MINNIFINENLKIIKIEYTSITNIIKSYNIIPYELLKKFNKYIDKYKKIDTFYGEITENNFKIEIIDENSSNYNELYLLVHNNFYEPNINFDIIFQIIDDPLTMTFDKTFYDAMNEIIVNTDRMKEKINDNTMTELLSDDDISDKNTNKMVDLDTYITETNI